MTAAASYGYAGFMRYPDGGGLDAGPAASGWGEDQGAWLIFEDESGQGLRPPKGRIRGRRGALRIVSQAGRRLPHKMLAGSHRCRSQERS